MISTIIEADASELWEHGGETIYYVGGREVETDIPEKATFNFYLEILIEICEVDHEQRIFKRKESFSKKLKNKGGYF